MELITTEEYKEKLKNKAPDFECLGEYQGNKIKIPHRHKICGYEWDVKPNSLLSGQGCPNCKKIMMSKKQLKTHEQYVSDLAEINPDFEVLEEYKGNKTAILHKHKICGHEWKVRPNNMLGGSGCPKCYGHITHEEYVSLLNDKNPDFEVIEKYESSHTNILHRHKVCGYEWRTAPVRMLNGCGCPKCSNRLLKTHEQYLHELNERQPDFECLEQYNGTNTKILHRHKTCGFEWKITPHRIMTDGCCPYCSEKVRKTTDYYKQELVKMRPEYEVLGEYVNTNTPILHKHILCGYEWNVRPHDILHGGYGCPVCACSKGEDVILNYLNTTNIDFKPQHKYDDLLGLGGGLLSYDFYLPSYNLLIEFQGKQHYEPIKWFGGEEKFKYQQEHDKRKREYAKLHNIELMEIPYWDFDNIKSILESRLSNQSTFIS